MARSTIAPRPVNIGRKEPGLNGNHRVGIPWERMRGEMWTQRPDQTVFPRSNAHRERMPVTL